MGISTYGSELVASRIAIKMIIALRFFLFMLGANAEPSSCLDGNDMAVVLNTTIPSSFLKKKHQGCNYFRVRKSFAARFIRYRHIRSMENVVDLLTKPLERAAYGKLTSKYLFRRPKTIKEGLVKDDARPC